MDVSAGHAGNADQIVYWNGRVGRHWTDRQELQDQLLTPVLDVLIDRVGAKPGDQIIDVGCGCGATSLALATQVTPSGHVLGIDISAPMLDRARQLAPVGSPVEWILADATVFPFFGSPLQLAANSSSNNCRSYKSAYSPSSRISSSCVPASTTSVP